jgi:hypothetical protein
MAHSELKAYSSDEEIEESDEEQIIEIAQHPKLSPGMRRVDSLELHRLRVPTRAPRRRSRLEPKEPSSPPSSWKIFSMLGLSHAVKA